MSELLNIKFFFPNANNHCSWVPVTKKYSIIIHWKTNISNRWYFPEICMSSRLLIGWIFECSNYLILNFDITFQAGILPQWDFIISILRYFVVFLNVGCFLLIFSCDSVIKIINKWNLWRGADERKFRYYIVTILLLFLFCVFIFVFLFEFVFVFVNPVYKLSSLMYHIMPTHGLLLEKLFPKIVQIWNFSHNQWTFGKIIEVISLIIGTEQITICNRENFLCINISLIRTTYWLE